MNYSLLDFLSLLGSLGLFLYGMKIMSEGLQKAAGDRLRSLLSAITSNRFLGALTGLFITAMIQSSSATTVMVVSFVNAGLLNLTQAIGVIMGANIGTTATAWVISLLGFKVEISAFTIPMMAIGIPLIFSKKSNLNAIGEFIFGFALLFLGLEFLKNSMPDLQSSPEALAFLSKYTGMGYGSILIFLLIGSVLTLIVQSSSAMVAITLVMCAQGWIPFHIGAAMILGENIGTTITANLAALSANTTAKRAAFSHLLFNVFGVLWVLILFFPVTNLVASMVVSGGGADPRELYDYIGSLGSRFTSDQISLMTGGETLTDPEMSAVQGQILSYVSAVSIGLSLFHTCFNVTNMLLMIWFIPLYAKICEQVIRPAKKHGGNKEYSHLQFVSAPLLSTGELSLLQVQREMGTYLSRIRTMLAMVRELYLEEDPGRFTQTFTRLEKYENICDRVEIEIVDFLTRLSTNDLSKETHHDIQAYMRCATEIESMGDSCFNIGRALRRQRGNSVEMAPELVATLLELHALCEQILDNTVATVETYPRDESFFYKAQNLENEMNNRRDALEKQNIADVGALKYPYEASVYYVDDIDEYEHFADYAINVVEALTNKKH